MSHQVEPSVMHVSKQIDNRINLRQSSRPTMERSYDIFETMPDGAPLWRSTVSGHEQAIAKLRELAAKSSNELQVLHLPTKTLIASMNGKPGD